MELPLSDLSPACVIDVQYRQSESDGESHRTSFTMDPIEFF